jgi:hypothetical protein
LDACGRLRDRHRRTCDVHWQTCHSCRHYGCRHGVRWRGPANRCEVVAGLDDLRQKLIVIPSEARNPHRPDRGSLTRTMRILRFAQDDNARMKFLTLILASLVSLACDGGTAVRTAAASTADSTIARERAEVERTRQDSIVRSRPGYIVDSILPVEEEVRRFEATIAKRPTGLVDGARSRSALVASFVSALEHNDTTALARLVVNRAEFAYLIYPTSPNAAPPYRQSPELVWMSRSASTDKALTRLFSRFGGKPLRFAGLSCPDSVDHQGTNALWSGCVVKRITSEGDTTRLRMFGAIVGRDGRFKFLSLTNGL